MRNRAGAAALAGAGVMFLLYPAIRPWHDETMAAGARESMASTAWVAAHFFGMLGFIAVPMGLLALHALIRTRLSLAALLTAWAGAGLTLPYYGAEDFGLHALARANSPDLLTVVDQVRYQPLAATIFAVGLLALGAGAVLAAVAVWRSGLLPRPAGGALRDRLRPVHPPVLPAELGPDHPRPHRGHRLPLAGHTPLASRPVASCG